MNKTIALLTILISMLSCASNLKNEDLAREYYNIGNEYFDLKKYDKANQYYKKAIELDAAFSKARFNYAQSLLKLNKFEEAIQLLESLSAEDPDNTLVLTLIGYAYHAQNLDDKALATFEKIIARSPDNTAALYNSGIILWKTGKMEDAQKRFERAITLAPDDLDVIYNLGNLFFDLANYEKAISFLSRYLQKKPSDEKVFLLYARSYGMLEEYAPALEAYDQVLAINANNKDAWFEKADMLLTKAKDPGKGIIALTQAFDKGYADKEKITRLYDSPDLADRDIVRKFIEDRKILAEPEKDKNVK